MSILNEEVVRQTFEISDTDSNRYLAAPTITSLTLVSNWSSAAEESLKHAVNKLVELNPILTGKLIQNPKGINIQVVSGEHFDLFDVIDGPSSFVLPKDVYGRIKALHTHIEPCFDVLGLPIEQLATGSRLFGVSVCRLPDSHACYLIQLSHMIGDGATYYMLLGQLQDLIQGKNVETIPKFKCI